MKATLINVEGTLEDIHTIEIPSTLTFPPYIAYRSNLYKCNDVTSRDGTYSLQDSIHVPTIPPTTKSLIASVRELADRLESRLSQHELNAE